MRVYEIGWTDDCIEVKIIYKTRPQVKIKWMKLQNGIHRKRWELVDYKLFKLE